MIEHYVALSMLFVLLFAIFLGFPVAFTLAGRTPREVASFLGERGIYVWDGHYYALEVVRRLGLEASGGMVRVGLAHYNTMEEVDRLGEALEQLVERGAVSSVARSR